MRGVPFQQNRKSKSPRHLYKKACTQASPKHWRILWRFSAFFLAICAYYLIEG
jgi:hypothetical protein